jgi:hypothetical protein
MELWVGCVAGALTDADYKAKLAAAGFENADIEITRVYKVEDAREFLAGQGTEVQQLAQQVDGKIVSGFIRAIKPLTQAAASEAPNATTTKQPAAQESCCASSCCGAAAKG